MDFFTLDLFYALTAHTIPDCLLYGTLNLWPLPNIESSRLLTSRGAVDGDRQEFEPLFLMNGVNQR
jgi:hypothetical protein